MQQLKFTSRKFDYLILVAAILLLIIGISTIQSTILAAESGNTVLNSQLINRQLFAISAGLLVFFLTVYFNYRYLELISPVIYLVVIALLVGVLLVNTQIRGVARWYDLGPFQFQPSTMSAVLLGICFSAYFAWVKERISRVGYLVIAILMAIIPTFLILIEPDLGSAIVVAAIFIGLLHLVPLKISRLIILYILVLISIPFAWTKLEDYQRERVISFIEPAKDPLGSGYNALQSMIAVGSGQIFGRGWGRGTQSHLQFLPEQHTDFIFATYAEEQGYLGVFVVILLYAIIIWRTLLLVRRTTDYFGQLLLVSMIVWLSTHVFVNIAMNIGIAPVTGIPLPFLSYGGTSVITTFLALGIIESVAIHGSS
jgi:rod shape determining protein RodA